MFYTVLEIQVNNGSKSCIPVIYDNINDAYNKLYTILAYASVSECEYHSGCILRSDGILIDGKVFDRMNPVEV